MAEPIYYVCGFKGGTGKSFVSLALVDFLACTQQKKVYLVDTDTANPDVGQVYYKVNNGMQRIPGRALNLDIEGGWHALFNDANQHLDHCLVINTGSRNEFGLLDNADFFQAGLEGQGRQLTTFWVANDEKDGLVMLKRYMDAIPFSVVHMVCNEYFGRDGFNTYDESQIKKRVEAQGKTLNFPKLSETLRQKFRDKKLSPSDVMDGQDASFFSERIVLGVWRRKYTEMFSEVIL